MERKWLALTPGDTLPLKLGRKVFVADSTKLDVAALSNAPGVIVGIDYSSEVTWASALDDNAVQRSDLKHESAPKLGGIPTKASVKKSIVDMVNTMYKTAQEVCGIPKVERADRMSITRAEAERATANFINLPLAEQDCLLPIKHSMHRKDYGERYEYQSKCGCDECCVVRTMVNRERKGDFGKTKRGVPALQSFQAEALAKLQASASPDANDALAYYVEGVRATREQFHAWQARQPATTDAMLMAQAAQGVHDAAERERRRRSGACHACGVGIGEKHFLSCWKVRPELLVSGSGSGS